MLTWELTAKYTDKPDFFDIFVNSIYYRRVKITANGVSKDNSMRTGDPVYFPSITEMRKTILSPTKMLLLQFT